MRETWGFASPLPRHGIRQRFDFSDYVQLEEVATSRHEYLGGMVWAMAGGSVDHARVAANLVTLLSAQLAGRRCCVFSSDLRLRVVATGLATYADVVVLRERVELDPEDPTRRTVVNPSLVAEVLSPASAEYDEGEKVLHYQQVDSVQEILLISHDERRADIWRRERAGWALTSARDCAKLASLECELPLDRLYFDPLEDSRKEAFKRHDDRR